MTDNDLACAKCGYVYSTWVTYYTHRCGEVEEERLMGECTCGGNVNNLGKWHTPSCPAVAPLTDLEREVVEAAIGYVGGVGYDGGSLQAEHDALARFAKNHNQLITTTERLITARKESK